MALALLITRLLLALLFAVAALTKLADRPGTKRAVVGFGVAESLADGVALAVPVAELVVAALLIPGALAWWGGLGALALLLAFSAAIAINLARGNAPDCHCFGQLHSEPVSPWTLVRNGVLAAIASFVVGGGSANRDGSAFHTLSQVPADRWVEFGAGTLVVALLAAQLWLVLRLARQNEQLLIRLKMIEADVRGEAPAQPDDEPAVQQLTPGSPAPVFELPDLHGATVTLDSLCSSGKPLLLVFTDPGCGSCTALMPGVVQWEREYGAHMEIVVISAGTVEENERKAAEYGLTRVLLQHDREVENAYGIGGTPGAVVVRPDGSIGSPVAPGVDAIRALFDQLLTLLLPAVEVHAPVSMNGGLPGPKIEVPAPPVRLPDLEGRMVDLSEFRGERTLLLFWYTGCSYCQQMLPALKAWEANRPAGVPQLVVVATGPEDEVRVTNFRSPVLLDPDFATARAFDINGTPLAALLDTDGTYVTRIAGELDILAALRGEIEWAPAALEA